MSTSAVLNNLQGELHQRIILDIGTITKSVISLLKVPPVSELCKEDRNNMATASSQTTISNTSMEHVRREAEFMAQFVVHKFVEGNTTTPQNKYCKTMFRTVNELSVKHNIVFKGIFKKLNPNDDDLFQTFSVVADEIFVEGQINWGRIVSVYAFAAHLAKHITNKTDSGSNSESSDIDDNQHENTCPRTRRMSTQSQVIDRFATFVGQYVTHKLGTWIVDQGGWDAFLEFFPDPQEFESKIWKIGVITAIGLGAMATLITNR